MQNSQADCPRPVPPAENYQSQKALGPGLGGGPLKGAESKRGSLAGSIVQGCRGCLGGVGRKTASLLAVNRKVGVAGIPGRRGGSSNLPGRELKFPGRGARGLPGRRPVGCAPGSGGGGGGRGWASPCRAQTWATRRAASYGTASPPRPLATGKGGGLRRGLEAGEGRLCVLAEALETLLGRISGRSARGRGWGEIRALPRIPGRDPWPG